MSGAEKTVSVWRCACETVTLEGTSDAKHYPWQICEPEMQWETFPLPWKTPRTYCHKCKKDVELCWEAPESEVANNREPEGTT